MWASLRYFTAYWISSNIPLGTGKIGNSNSNTGVAITLLTYSPSYKVNGGIPSLALPNDVLLFTLAVLIIRIYIALNASLFATWVVRVLSLF